MPHRLCFSEVAAIDSERFCELNFQVRLGLARAVQRTALYQRFSICCFALLPLRTADATTTTRRSVRCPSAFELGARIAQARVIHRDSGRYGVCGQQSEMSRLRSIRHRTDLLRWRT